MLLAASHSQILGFDFPTSEIALTLGASRGDLPSFRGCTGPCLLALGAQPWRPAAWLPRCRLWGQ